MSRWIAKHQVSKIIQVFFHRIFFQSVPCSTQCIAPCPNVLLFHVWMFAQMPHVVARESKTHSSYSHHNSCSYCISQFSVRWRCGTPEDIGSGAALSELRANHWSFSELQAKMPPDIQDRWNISFSNFVPESFRLLGSGNFSTVYLCRVKAPITTPTNLAQFQTYADQPVAVKLLRGEIDLWQHLETGLWIKQMLCAYLCCLPIQPQPPCICCNLLCSFTLWILWQSLYAKSSIMLCYVGRVNCNLLCVPYVRILTMYR